MTKDTTFTAGDLIRIFCHNLDSEEQKEVTLFFLVIYPGLLLTNAQVAAILARLKGFMPNWLFRNVLSLFMIAVGEIRTFINKSWAEIIFNNPDTRKEVINCIDKRLKAPREEKEEKLIKLLKEKPRVLLRGKNVLSTGRVLRLNQ